jgi:hypothetical protein
MILPEELAESVDHDDASFRILRHCMAVMEPDSIFCYEVSLFDMFFDPWLQDRVDIRTIFRAHSVS